MAIQQGDFRSLLSALTLEEKVRLLSGQTFTSAAGIERLNIPRITVADSTSGIRPAQHDSDMTTACFPNTTCLAATWDVQLLEELGGKLAQQARMKAAQVVLGPNINMHRDPRGGRNFESFSEDPLLAGQLGAAIVNGVQKQGVGSCPKHFVCNDSEFLRHFYNVAESVDGRTLREIYLASWSHLLRACDPAAIMMAYNKVDGEYCSGHQDLIERVLRGSWGFKGVVMSDWFGTHSTVEAIKAGLDLEMPFPVHRGQKLIATIQSGAVTEEELDARVLKLLELRNRTRESHAEGAGSSEIDEATNKTARDLAAGGIILLKNEGEALPLEPSSTTQIAVIGGFAHYAVVTGGGSASCNPQYKIRPVQALEEALPNGCKVQFSTGVRTRRIIPVAPPELLKTADGHPGAEIKYFNDDSTDAPILVERRDKPHVWMLGEFPAGLKVPGSRIEMETSFSCPSNGTHTLAVRCTGAFSLYVDEKEVLARPEPDVTTEQFIFNHVLLESRFEMAMSAGTTYDIKLVMRSRDHLMIGEPTPYAASLCFEERLDEERSIQDAMEVARQADVSIVFAGRDGQYESEGYDLEDIAMPANQTALIKAVASVSKCTVLVLHCGNPIDVSAFVDDVDAILCAHFPGQEGSRALADILLGNVNPSGRTATTWFKTLKDAPSFDNFPAHRDKEGNVLLHYREGIQVGYRHPDKERVRWPFGYGLSYTRFEYAGLEVSVAGVGATATLKCLVTLTNTGTRTGHEVVPAYVTPARGSSVWRPEKELKAFTKVFLQPGESRVVTLETNLRVACSYWCEAEKQWLMEEGIYGVSIGQLCSEFSVSEKELWDGL